MIKRQYFIKAEIHEGNSILHFYRQYWYKSWLANPADALNYRLEILATKKGIDVSEIIVTAFNRL